MKAAGKTGAGTGFISRATALFLKAAAAALLLMLASCSEVPVAQDLTQEQSREIVAALTRYGIKAEASREIGGAGRFKVEVRQADYQQAVLVMQEKSLPSKAPPSFEDLVSVRGLLPGSRELESLKADRAVAAEIEQSLLKLPGVESARVIVRRSSLQPVRGETSQPGVSVVLVEKLDQKVLPAEVTKIVSQAVSGVALDRISLIVHPAFDEGFAKPAGSEGVVNDGGLNIRRVPLAEFIFGWKVADEDYTGLVGLTVFLVIGAFAGGFGLAWLMLRAKPALTAKTQPAQQAPQEQPAPRVVARVKSLID